MTRSHRILLALILLVALPLRAFAAIAMPCCPPEATDHAAMTVSMASDCEHEAAMSHDDGSAPVHDHHDVQPCCAVALIATPAFALELAPYVPPHDVVALTTPIAPFITEAPDRPPRHA